MSIDLLDAPTTGAPAPVDAPPMSDDKPKTLSVKLHLDVIESARIVAAFTGETMTDLMSDILRPALAKMETEAIARRTGRPRPKGPKGGSN